MWSSVFTEVGRERRLRKAPGGWTHDRHRALWAFILITLAFLVAGCGATPAPGGDEVADMETIQVQIAAGDFESAKAGLTQMLADDEDNADAHFQLGLVYFGLGDYRLAEEHFNRTLELDPDRASAVHHNLGVLAFQEGRLDVAREAFNAALEADPEDADTHYQLGATYLMQSFPEDAIQPEPELLAQAEAEFELARDLAPEKVEALVGLANAAMLRNDMDGAMQLLKDALERVPDMPEALFALGRVYAITGQADEAATTLQRFLETDPPQPWVQEAEDLLQQVQP